MAGGRRGERTAEDMQERKKVTDGGRIQAGKVVRKQAEKSDKKLIKNEHSFFSDQRVGSEVFKFNS